MWFKKKFTVLIICKANITRSAYIAAYMEHYLKTQLPHLRKKIKITSAGVQARRGKQAHRVMQHAAKTNGFSLGHHLSSPLTRKTIQKSDVILIMEEQQKERLLSLYPQAENKTFLLMEYLWNGDPKEVQDVPDPTGQNTDDYARFLELAHTEVDRIFREIESQSLIQ